MTDQLYLQPITLVTGPQAVAGDAVRLGGSMVYAREFAVIVRRDGVVASREVVTKSTAAAAFARLPDALAAEAEAQWAGLFRAHAPLQLVADGGKAQHR